MDPDRRDEVDDFLRRSRDPAGSELFDSIPGYDIDGENPPLVIQNAQRAHVGNAAAPGGGGPIAPRPFMSTQEARAQGIVLASARAQIPVDGDNDEEDFYDLVYSSDDEGEVDTTLPAAPPSRGSS